MVDYDIYSEFRNPETYDIECDSFDEDFPAIEQWAQKLGSPLLDLACGTGRMAIHLAQKGYQVTGVDLMSEMIEHAKKKAANQGVAIDWVVSDARSFQLDRQFPFVFMLMNAFQFLLTREDHEAMFACVREHLQADGYFLFETRNPTERNLTDIHHPKSKQYDLQGGGVLDVQDERYYDPLTQIQHYTSLRKLPDQTDRINRVALRYIYPQEMEALLYYNGFKIHTVYGSWKQDPLTATSDAMIYVCQKA